MLFELVADGDELLVDLGHDVPELVDCLRRADAGDDVFALRVEKEFAEDVLFARRRVAGEGDARAGRVAEVAEDHLLNVDGRAPPAGDVVEAAVDDGAFVVPGAENGLDGSHELLLRVARELGADVLFVFPQEHLRELSEVFRRELGVVVDAALLLHLVDEVFKVLLADAHDDVRVHLDKAPVAVVSPARVAGLSRHDFDDLFV